MITEKQKENIRKGLKMLDIECYQSTEKGEWDKLNEYYISHFAFIVACSIGDIPINKIDLEDCSHFEGMHYVNDYSEVVRIERINVSCAIVHIRGHKVRVSIKKGLLLKVSQCMTKRMNWDYFDRINIIN